MKSMLTFWMGWSLGFVALAEYPVTRVIAAAFALFSFAMWCYLQKRGVSE
jgi:hypothetical protein